MTDSTGVLDAMRIRVTWVFGLAIAASACSSDRSYSPPGTILTDSRVSQDVAVTAGIAAASSIENQSQYLDNTGVSPSIETVGRLGNISTGTPAPAPTADNSTPSAGTSPKPVCTYGTAGLWTCAPFVNTHGLTVVLSYRYFDQAGKAMEHYDQLGTARIEYMSKSDGAVGDGVTLSGTTHHNGEQTLSGLLGAETTRQWDGASVNADTMSYHDGSGTRRYAGVQLDSVKRVIYAHPRPRGSYPLSGEIVRVANYLVTAIGSGTETRSVSRTIVTTFNGTAAVPIRIGAISCTLHLDTRAVEGCSGR